MKYTSLSYLGYHIYRPYKEDDFFALVDTQSEKSIIGLMWLTNMAKRYFVLQSFHVHGKKCTNTATYEVVSTQEDGVMRSNVPACHDAARFWYSG